MNNKKSALALFFGGLLPVIIFTVIEEKYGTWYGLIAGMIFGCGEIAWELIKYKKVSGLTWFGNSMLLGLGVISLISSDGIWFKLQPAIMEAAFALILWGSILIKKPLIVFLAEKQGQVFPELIKNKLVGVTFRTGLFLALHAALATWAAYKWTSTQWAMLKGLGLTISFIIYLLAEALYLRWSLRKQLPPPPNKTS